MIREFLFKVLIQMYNQIFYFQLKLKTILHKFNIKNDDIFKIKNVIEKFFINQFRIFALNKTTALHQRRGVLTNDGMIKTYS